LTRIDKEFYHRVQRKSAKESQMIARVARFRFPSLRHREEAERNGSERVGPSLARQPGFQAIYYGRIAELQALSISLFDDRETADAAAMTMNAEPLLPGQAPDVLPTPEAVTFYDVVNSLVRDQVPAAGRMGYLTLAASQDEADRWVLHAFGPMLEGAPGLSQAYLLRSADGSEWISLTFWASPEAMQSGGAAIGSWQAGEASAGRGPAFVGSEAHTLTDLRVAIAGVPATIPAPV
jgi:heme-degrading monooxygenase HmoA